MLNLKNKIKNNISSALIFAITLCLISIFPQKSSAFVSGNWIDENNYSTNWYQENSDINQFNIKTAEDFAGLAVLNNNHNIDFSGKKIILNENIDMSNHYWAPIGTSASPFKGLFDANNKIIKGITSNDNGQNTYQGLFGVIDHPDSVIENIKMHESNIIGNQYIGGVAALLKTGTIRNCVVDGSIKLNNSYVSPTKSSMPSCDKLSLYDELEYPRSRLSLEELQDRTTNNNKKIGGIVGYNEYGVISHCSNKSNVNFIDNSNEFNICLGGIAGESQGQINDCNNQSDLSLSCEKNISYYIGGIAGLNNGGIYNCFNKSSKSELYFSNLKKTNYFGGIAGESNKLIIDCINKSTILSTATDNTKIVIGGIVGLNSSTTKTCLNIQDINLNGNHIAGGIVGKNESDAKIVDSFSKGNIKNSNEKISNNISEKNQRNIKDIENQKISELYFKLGNYYKNNKENTNAIDLYLMALTHEDNWISNNRSEVCFELGKCYSKSNQIPKAIEMYNNALDQKSTGLANNRSEVLFELGKCYIKNNQITKAIEMYNNALDQKDKGLFNNRSQVLVELGKCYGKSNQITKAIEAYEEALKQEDTGLANNRSEVLFKLSLCYGLNNQITKAIETYEEALKQEDKWISRHKSQVYYFLATSYSQNNQISKAIETYEEVLKQEDKDFANNRSQVIFELGKCYSKSNQIDIALKMYTNALNQKDEWIDKNKSQVYYRLALSYSKINQTNNAVKKYKKALNQKDDWISQNKSRIYYYLGKICFGQRRYLTAINFYDASLRQTDQWILMNRNAVLRDLYEAETRQMMENFPQTLYKTGLLENS